MKMRPPEYAGFFADLITGLGLSNMASFAMGLDFMYGILEDLVVV